MKSNKTLQRKTKKKKTKYTKRSDASVIYLNTPTLNAVRSVADRVKELQLEEEQVKKMVDDQFGVTIPRAFNVSANNFIVDPSNVGTGILDRMIKTDDTIESAVQFKILMVMSKIGEYQHDNTEIKKFVQGFLNDMKSPTWRASMESMLSYHGYKFSVSEIIFGMDSEFRKVPRKISSYHPSTIAFEVDENGEITENGILQFTNQHVRFSNPNFRFTAIRHGFKVRNPFSTPVDRLHPHRIPFFTQIGMVRIPRNKVIHFIGQQFNSFGNPYGNSPVRTAHLLWQLKVFILKQMGIASKRRATPRLWGTAPHGKQKVEVTRADGTKEQVSPAEALRLMLKDMETDDSIVTGTEEDGYKITALTDTVNLDQFVSVINALNTWIFRSFLIPSLVLSDGTAGSRSLGDKHFQIVDRIAEADADTFGETIINELIERVIIENFGIQMDLKDNYGTFARRPQTIEERQRLASMFGQLANDGYMSPGTKQDMSFVRDSLNLPQQKRELGKDVDGTIPEEELFPGEQIPGTRGFDPSKIDAIIKVVEKVIERKIPRKTAVQILVDSGLEEGSANAVVPNGNAQSENETGEPPVEDSAEMSDEEIANAVSEFERVQTATEEGGEENPPAWVAEEGKWAKAKRASQKAFGEIRFPFVTHFYLEVLNGKKK